MIPIEKKTKKIILDSSLNTFYLVVLFVDRKCCFVYRRRFVFFCLLVSLLHVIQLVRPICSFPVLRVSRYSHYTTARSFNLLVPRSSCRSLLSLYYCSFAQSACSPFFVSLVTLTILLLICSTCSFPVLRVARYSRYTTARSLNLLVPRSSCLSSLSLYYCSFVQPARSPFFVSLVTLAILLLVRSICPFPVLHVARYSRYTTARSLNLIVPRSSCRSLLSLYYCSPSSRFRLIKDRRKSWYTKM